LETTASARWSLWFARRPKAIAADCWMLFLVFCVRRGVDVKRTVVRRVEVSTWGVAIGEGKNAQSGVIVPFLGRE
jgi:hypothetical protein